LTGKSQGGRTSSWHYGFIGAGNVVATLLDALMAVQEKCDTQCNRRLPVGGHAFESTANDAIGPANRLEVTLPLTVYSLVHPNSTAKAEFHSLWWKRYPEVCPVGFLFIPPDKGSSALQPMPTVF
jgi:hypothetical protein